MGITHDLEVTRKEMIASFLLLSGMGALILSVFLGMNAPGKGTSESALCSTPAIVTPPPGGGGGNSDFYSWGGIQYNYEWGWYNYATGTFKMTAYENSTLNSNSQFVFSNTNVVPYRHPGGAGSISSQQNGQPQTFWNLTNPDFQTMSDTDDTVFHASDWIQSNTDNVEIGIDITAGGLGVTGWYTGNSHTVIDWQNIAELVLAVAGS